MSHTTSTTTTYRVHGSVRGTVSRHRTLAAAVRGAAKDRRACRRLGGGAYSDVQVQRRTAQGWETVGQCELEVAGLVGSDWT